MSFVDKIMTAILATGTAGSSVPAGAEKTTERPVKGLQSFIRKAYYDLLLQSQDRKDKYKKYDYLDMNLAEGSSALNIYADNIVSGSIGGAENYKVVIGK